MLAMRVNTPSAMPEYRADDRFAVAFKPQMTRREAEVLFEIDAEGGNANPGWTAYFVETLTEFMVFGERPTGFISERDARWLVSLAGDSVSSSLPALLRALILQSEAVPECLIELAMRCGAMRPCGTALV